MAEHPVNDLSTIASETDDRLHSHVSVAGESEESMVNNTVENGFRDNLLDLNPSETTEPISIFKSDTVTDTNPVSEQDSNDDSSSDSMPDLLWPEKKSNLKKSNGATSTTTLSSSTSQDTGFVSDNIVDTPSPDEASKSMDDSLGKNSSETSVNKSKEQAEFDTPEEDGVMDILGNGLLKKKILIPGKGVDTRPNNGDTVTLKVDGVLENGTHVDTGEISFILNDGDVILAFDIAVALMEEGEKCELSTAAKYAFGSLGREPDIPKEANITYTLELVNIQSPPELSSLSYDERLKLGEAKRERGNYLFGRTDYTGAINSYNKAIKILADTDLNASLDEANLASLTESSLKCYNNMAACQLKIDALDAAIRSCEKVLTSQENNIKALFRIGKAYGAKGEIEHAITYIRRAIKLEPESKMLHQEMLNLNRRRNKETATERELYQRMLGVKPENKVSTDKNKKASNSNSFLKWALLVGGVAATLASVGLAIYRTS
ncbi:unnamed protein product [Lymnaea stagnalis]|uniref:peptidylprolyl isomerase n=1 Tax=Lymnaea stagnalis TaxID=6523 RepID=A0AAV2I3A2_LYMST